MGTRKNQNGYGKFLAGKWISFTDSPPVESEEVLLSDGMECWIGIWEKKKGATLPENLADRSATKPSYWLPLPFPPEEPFE